MIAIGIEVGSTAVKAAAFDTVAQLLGEASRRLQTRSAAPGLCELDFEEIIAAVGSVVREISVSTGQEAGLLAITGQSDGLWLLDQGGYAVRPPITAADTRAASYVQEWFAKGIAAVAFRRSGNAPFLGAPSALIRFLADHEPESLIQAAVATSCKEPSSSVSREPSQPTFRTPPSLFSTCAAGTMTKSSSISFASVPGATCSRRSTALPLPSGH